jgi:hypothetical protein
VVVAKVTPKSSCGDGLIPKSYAESYAGGADVIRCEGSQLLPPGEHFTMPDCPGLRFEASATARAWIYRFKSPIDGKIRQVKLGDWPAMSVNAAKVEWEKLRDQRAKGQDPAAERRAERVQERKERDTEREQRAKQLTVRTVTDVLD